jgi:uncharacterized membrane protein YjjB (DUF3815 family)
MDVLNRLLRITYVMNLYEIRNLITLIIVVSPGVVFFVPGKSARDHMVVDARRNHPKTV